VRSFRLQDGLPRLAHLRAEIDSYLTVLLGRAEPPVDAEDMTLMEYANAVYSRAVEINILLQRAEADGEVVKASALYKFRTGELRSFIELASKAIDLGSRRVTAANVRYDARRG
jgi:hypothetical protein